MKVRIELPLEYPSKICLESISRSASLPPQHAWSRRLTLFGSGELQSVKVKGYLPAYTTINSAGQHVDDLSLWSDNPELSPVLKHLVLIEGKLALSPRTKLDNLSFSWEREDGSKGSAELFRKKLSPERAADILRDVYNSGIGSLPDLIGAPAPGAHGGSMIFCCKLNSTLFEKEIRIFSYRPDEELARKYGELSNLIDTHLERAWESAETVKKDYAWWQFWK
jgi:hypothetical protein